MNTQDLTAQNLRDLFTDTRAQFAETDRRIAEVRAEARRQEAELRAQTAKTDALVSRLAKMYGGVVDNLGVVDEEFYYNSLKDSMIFNNMRFDYIERNISRSRDGTDGEYDILMVNAEDVVMIEVKHKLHQHDLERMLGRKIPDFKTLFREYNSLNHHYVLAGFCVDDELKKDILNHGISVLQRKGDLIETWVA